MRDTLGLRSAGQSIDIHCNHEPTRATLRALFKPALRLRERYPDSAKTRWVICLTESGQILLDGKIVFENLGPLDGPPKVEELLVRDIPATRKEALHLHCGCVELSRCILLFVGPSGAGKSTFSRLGVQAGGALLTDDSLVVDERRAFGVPRTIHFDGLSPGEALPVHLADCDIKSYQGVFRNAHRRIPLWVVEHEVIDSLPLDEKPWVVASLERAEDDSVRATTSIERLSALHGATVTMGRDYGGEFGWGPSFAIGWKDPQRAFAQLMDRLGS